VLAVWAVKSSLRASWRRDIGGCVIQAKKRLSPVQHIHYCVCRPGSSVSIRLSSAASLCWSAQILCGVYSVELYVCTMSYAVCVLLNNLLSFAAIRKFADQSASKVSRTTQNLGRVCPCPFFWSPKVAAAGSEEQSPRVCAQWCDCVLIRWLGCGRRLWRIAACIKKPRKGAGAASGEGWRQPWRAHRYRAPTLGVGETKCRRRRHARRRRSFAAFHRRAPRAAPALL